MRKQLTGTLAAMMTEVVNGYNNHIAEAKKGSLSKYGFVEKIGKFIPFLSPKRLADQLDISVKTLERLRKANVGPSFIKIGNNRVRYSIVELDAWCRANTQETAATISHSAPLPSPVTTGGDDELQCNHKLEKAE